MPNTDWILEGAVNDVRIFVRADGFRAEVCVDTIGAVEHRVTFHHDCAGYQAAEAFRFAAGAADYIGDGASGLLDDGTDLTLPLVLHGKHIHGTIVTLRGCDAESFVGAWFEY